MTESKNVLFTLGTCATCGGREQYFEEEAVSGKHCERAQPSYSDITLGDTYGGSKSTCRAVCA